MAREIKNLLVHHLHDRALAAAVATHVSGRLLDIGCGTKPYAGLLAPRVRRHVGIDHPGTPHDRSRIDVFATASGIPFADGSFDAAFCTAVLEHLEEPERALRECRRVLRPGGVAVYTAPFIWHVHEEPRDFFRFSPYGLRYLFEKAGFEIVELRALSGFWVTGTQLFVYNLYRLNKGPLRWLRIIDLLGLLFQGIGFLLDKIDRNERFSWMHLVVARNPGSPAGCAAGSERTGARG